MNTEQRLLSRWRDLPPEQQREVIDFIEFLADRVPSSNLSRRRPSVPDLIESVRRHNRELPENVEWLDSSALLREDRDGR